MVPLEVEVSSNNAGVFVPQGLVDFGVGGSMDPPKQMKLYLQNPFKKVVKIQSITTTSRAIKITYDTARLSGDTKNQPSSVEVATLTLNCKIY